MKGLQLLNDDYLEHSKKMSPTQIATFLEDFRLLQAETSKTKLISIRVDENLLKAFKAKCSASGLKYQTTIKDLMVKFL